MHNRSLGFAWNVLKAFENRQNMGGSPWGGGFIGFHQTGEIPREYCSTGRDSLTFNHVQMPHVQISMSKCPCFANVFYFRAQISMNKCLQKHENPSEAFPCSNFHGQLSMDKCSMSKFSCSAVVLVRYQPCTIMYK